MYKCGLYKLPRIITLILLTSSILFCQETPFNRGVNLTNWFQASNPKDIQFSKYTKKDLKNIHSLGCDVIRLPINLHSMTSGEPDYNLDPLFLFFLDQVVNWAEELGMHLILDNHTFSSSTSTDPDIGDVLIPVWKNMANHYKDYSTNIYYEILNEPHGISDAAWNAIQTNVIDSIRTIDTVHTIIVGPASWNSYNNLDDMPIYKDDNLIYTFHFYDPFIFTHQGATWTEPSMESLAGVPFPYDSGRMPECPQDLIDTWIYSNMNNYSSTGTVAHVNNLISIAAEFKSSRNVPIYCGEFGVYRPNSFGEDRTYWYKTVREAFESHSIGWTIWDYQGGFGLFETGTFELFDYDLNIDLLEALNFTIPPQDSFTIIPDSSAIPIYSDYTEDGIIQSNWMSNGLLDYYSVENPAKGHFCIVWSGADRYNSVRFDFLPDRDFTYLVDNNYNLVFWLRSNVDSISFDLRMVDTKTDDPDDHPWRMRYIMDQASIGWDSSWKKISIPLSEFTEHGSWDNEVWYNPIGAFNWAKVDLFEIVAEHSDLNLSTLWFDQIAITKDNEVSITKNHTHYNQFILYQNYPNPFNPSTTIVYYLPNYEEIEISVYNILGKKIAVLFKGICSPGTHSMVWDGVNLNGKKVSSGIYILTIESNAFLKQRKMILIR
jgi:endoglucanase